MNSVNTQHKGYACRLVASWRNLWVAKETLSVRHIRPAFFQYFFAFPLAMIFINVQNRVLGYEPHTLGLPNTTIGFMAFAAGATILLALATPQNIAIISRISALMVVAGFAGWILLPAGYPFLTGEIILMAGVGGCTSSSSFSFVFVLNNAERFFSTAFMVLLIKVIELSTVAEPLHPIVKSIVAAVLLVPLVLCMILAKSKDYAEAGDKEVKKVDTSIWLTLFLLLAYFAIRITGFYAPAFSYISTTWLWGPVALLLLFLCVLQQTIFNGSVWTLCNVFFLSSVLSYVMWYLNLTEAAYLFSELKEIGFLAAFYLMGCVTNKFCNFRIHKRLIIGTMAGIGLLYVCIDAMHVNTVDKPIGVATAACLFAVFLLLSPAFSRHLFFADWSGEFRRVRMSALSESGPTAVTAQVGEHTAEQVQQRRLLAIEETNLSPREKQVVMLLLQGMALKQVASELGLTVSTVSTYTKSIYKKLGINSRVELFLVIDGGIHQTKSSGAGQDK